MCNKKCNRLCPNLIISTAVTLTTVFQSTHPMRGATSEIFRVVFCFVISIHAPHAGCDEDLEYILKIVKDFNPRTPCGVRPISGTPTSRAVRFQSTHPLRGATIPHTP